MVLAAACHPDAQRRVQEELDMVVGKDRSEVSALQSHGCLMVASGPDWRDFESLPQVHAFVSETLRWRPITPIGEYFITKRLTEIDFPLLQGLHTVLPRTLSGYVHHLLIHKSFVRANGASERPMYSCGCDCVRMPLVNHWFFFVSIT